jgi:hypothetical protein
MRTFGCLQTVAIALGIREFNYSTRQIVSAFPSLFKAILSIIYFRGLFGRRTKAVPMQKLEIAT